MTGREMSNVSRPAFHFRRNFFDGAARPPHPPRPRGARRAAGTPALTTDSEPGMNRSTKLCGGAHALCLLLVVAALLSGAAGVRAQSDEKQGGEAGARGAAATPSEVVRAYYTALREGRVLDAMRMTILRPAVESLSAAELEEYQPASARRPARAPGDLEIGGGQPRGDEATVFVKTGEGKELKVEPVELTR